MDGIKGISTEITDHRLMEEKLAKENAFYQAIIEQVKEGLCVCHKMPDCSNIEFTVWNKGMVEITGYTRDEVNHPEWRQSVYADPEQQESFVERIACVCRGQKRLGEGQKRVGEEWKITRKDCQKRILSVYTTFISSGMEPVHIVGIVHDITEKKRAEEALKRYSEHLEAIVEERTEQLKNAERLAALGETAAMVAHDLRNPLQSLFCMIYLARERLSLGNIFPTDGELCMEEILDNMAESVDYMGNIVSDIQDFVRKLKLNLVKTDISFFIRETLSTIDIPDNVHVTVQIEEKPIELNIDSEKMKRVIINLVTNSLNAMPEGGHIIISVRQIGDFVRVSVRDNGAGIPEEILPKLFLPLFTTRPKGMGHGLPVCKRMVDAMGGNIAVNSRVGEGTEAVIEIPVRQNSG